MEIVLSPIGIGLAFFTIFISKNILSYCLFLDGDWYKN